MEKELLACCNYLCEIIKQKSENNNIKLWPDFLNKINGNNQKYCNAFCFKVNKTGDKISFYDEICYKPVIDIDSNILKYENNYKLNIIN